MLGGDQRSVKLTTICPICQIFLSSRTRYCLRHRVEGIRSSDLWLAVFLVAYVFPHPPGALARLADFRDSLRLRVDRNGHTLDNLVGLPALQEEEWYRLPLLPFGGEHKECKLESEGWARAWHGSKMEAVCCIAYHGRLLASRAGDRGER